jgi:perosamine synthetase
MDNFIMQMRPWFGLEEKQAICEYMDEDGFITEFKRTEKFEQMLAEYTGAKHCIVVNNGTISLTLAAMAVGIKAADEVIVPNYTMIATPNSIKMFGAEPIFVDVEEETLCLDFELVKRAITSKTKAIMLVSANGRYPKAGINAFEKLCQENNIVLIEDSAQSLGSFYPDGRHIGTVGLVGSFSFSAPKIISTGQGGAVITNSDDLAQKVRRLKDFGRSGGGTDIHNSIGYNFKFTELQAVIGLTQMSKLSARVLRKREIWQKYQNGLSGVPQIRLFHHDLRYTTPWFIDCLAARRDELATHLKAKGIGTRVMYPPINSQVAYAKQGNYPISECIGSDGLWLPSYTQLEDEDIERICEEIEIFYRGSN